MSSPLNSLQPDRTFQHACESSHVCFGVLNPRRHFLFRPTRPNSHGSVPVIFELSNGGKPNLKFKVKIMALPIRVLT